MKTLIESSHPARSNISRRFPFAGAAWFFVAATIFLGLPACSTVKVSSHPERVTKEGIRAAEHLKRIGSGETAGHSKEMLALFKRAKKLDARNNDAQAAAIFLKVAVGARSLLAAGPHSPAELSALHEIHNNALARFANLWFSERRKSGAPPRLVVDATSYQITRAPDSDYKLDYFDTMVATKSLNTKGVIPKTRSGYGASLIGIRLKTPRRDQELRFYSHYGLHVPVTMVIGAPRPAASKGMPDTVPVSLLNPTLHESVRLQNRTLPLAADFSASIEMLLSGRNDLLWGLGGFFDAKKRAKTSGIYMLEAYDPKRIPVIFVHGLASAPIIWRNLLPNLMSEPDISKRYQFMVFTYPSSYLVVESALLFRQNLAAMRAQYDPNGRDPLSNNMVVVGHSMGGVLSRMLVSEIKDNLWKQVSNKPLDSIQLSQEELKDARELVFFDSDPAVTRAVFIATPHLGSKMAQISIAGFASSLVKLPGNILSTTSDILSNPALGTLKDNFDEKFTSIQSLNPDSPISKALAISPYKKGVIYHSIIGDRGKGDTPDSTDGVVQYWSSHQNGAASELIVPENHTNTYKNPHAINDIKRILRMHAGLKTNAKASPCPYYPNLKPPAD